MNWRDETVQPRVLVVDDNFELVRGLRGSLSEEGYEVFTAGDGLEGLKAARRYQPDVIVLDIGMPIIDGLEVCRQLRRDTELSQAPIILVTAFSSVEERVAGFEAGADDYLSKPFDIKELKARLMALLRRSAGSGRDRPASERLEVGPFTLEMQTCRVKVGEGDFIQLTPAECELLHFLMIHANRPFSSDQLLVGVWAYEPGTADPSLVRWHIRNLRHKIEPVPARPIYIQTLPRHGYILTAPDEAEWARR